MERLAQKWVSDLIYIKTEEGWLYLRAILELADRKVVGWALSNTMAPQSDQCGGLADGHPQQAGKRTTFVSF